MNLSLANIVFIGDRNHGKSSLVSSIFKLPILLSLNDHTRFPLHITIEHKGDKDFNEKEKQDAILQRNKIIEKSNEVKNKTGFSKDFLRLSFASDKIEVQLEDASMDSNRYSIIDLPGYVIPKQSHSLVIEENNSLIKSYIGDPKSIIVVVINVNFIGTSLVKGMVEERLGKNAKNVVWCLTHCDYFGGSPVDLEIKSHIENGWFAVSSQLKRSSDKNNIAESVKMICENEKDFFANHEYFSDPKVVPQTGRHNVLKKIDEYA